MDAEPKPEFITANGEPIKESEPWRCTHCEKLMFNVDEKGYPAPGAPTPLFVSVCYPKVCSLCWTLDLQLSVKGYWQKIEVEEVAKRGHIDGLRPGGTYFPT